MRGKFITFEGIDGAGKSSHIPGVCDFAGTRADGSDDSRAGRNALGEKLREILLNEPMHLETEALLMFAARREHLARVIDRRSPVATGWSATASPMPPTPTRGRPRA